MPYIYITYMPYIYTSTILDKMGYGICLQSPYSYRYAMDI